MTALTENEPVPSGLTTAASGTLKLKPSAVTVVATGTATPLCTILTSTLDEELAELTLDPLLPDVPLLDALLASVPEVLVLLCAEVLEVV